MGLATGCTGDCTWVCMDLVIRGAVVIYVYRADHLVDSPLLSLPSCLGRESSGFLRLAGSTARASQSTLREPRAKTAFRSKCGAPQHPSPPLPPRAIPRITSLPHPVPPDLFPLHTTSNLSCKKAKHLFWKSSPSPLSTLFSLSPGFRKYIQEQQQQRK